MPGGPTTCLGRQNRLQFGVQLQSFSGDNINPLGKLGPARFLDLNFVVARTQMHRLILVRCAGVSPVDEPGLADVERTLE